MDARYHWIIVVAAAFAACIAMFLLVQRLDHRGRVLEKREEEITSEIEGLQAYREEMARLRDRLETRVRSGLPDMNLSEECRRVYRDVMTGNPVLDTLIRFKMHQAEKEGISFECRKVMIPDGLLSDTELVSLFGNLINNAMETVRRTDAGKGISRGSGSVPQIGMEAGVIKNSWVLAVENLKPEDERPEASGFATTKIDRENHGLGTKIVRKTADAHKGIIKTVDSGRRFRVLVILPIENPRTQGRRMEEGQCAF